MEFTQNLGLTPLIKDAPFGGVLFAADDLTDQPKRPSRSGPMSGLIEDDGQIPLLLTPGGAGRVE